MVEVRWTPQASEDLESIADFISQDSLHYARLFVIDVLEAVERLSNFPKLGRIVPAYRPDPEIWTNDYLRRRK